MNILSALTLIGRLVPTLSIVLFAFHANAQVVDIPDQEFLNYLRSIGIDANNDGLIQVEEAESVGQLSITSNTIVDFTGIQSFTELIDLNITGSIAESLDLSNMTSLQFVNCSFNAFESITLENLENLTGLFLESNKLNAINVQTLVNLTELNVADNILTELDVSSNDLLNFLFCDRNNISAIDVSNLTDLHELFCMENMLSSLDVSQNKSLLSLFCQNNQIAELELNDLTDLNIVECHQDALKRLSIINCPNMTEVLCTPDNNGQGNLEELELINLPSLSYVFTNQQNLKSLDLSQLNASDFPFIVVQNNDIESLFVKNGGQEGVDLLGNPNLSYICADENEFQEYETVFESLGIENGVISSYCPHTNAGLPYKISGRNIYDADMDGCDETDFSIPNMKYTFSDGNDAATVVSDRAGDYVIYLAEGTYTLSPILENPSYFNVDPESVELEFNGSSSSLMQDFCIAPIADFSDVEVYLTPIEQARPGFEAKYKIVFRNKGTTTQSGTIRLFYPEALMDLESANPDVDVANGNSLFWSFEDLLPFENRQIQLSMGINTPMDDPPVNGDDVLSFLASINLENDTDINLIDNQSIVRQIVVNSFDPNDKTCLDGTRLDPELVGEYVRYMIRFENTGTADAINIVVRDSIDPVRLDINTLIPIDASHSMRTKIEGDIVEFIFEDINLPFEDALNDGYIVFKIRTRDDLVLGDVIENTAEIYFDFNFPIITNTTSTTIEDETAILETNTDTQVDIFPNPVTAKLYVRSEELIASAQILDLQGRTMWRSDSILSDATHIDIQTMAEGMYILQVVTSKEERNIKIYVRK